MPQLSNEDVVRAYARANETHDAARLTELRHPDWTAEWPQSGERVRGDANMRALDEHWPGGEPEPRATRVVGSEDHWVITPGYTLQRIVGSGDFWWADGTITYPDGSTWFLALLLELRDGRVYRETVYFAEPFEAQAWRAPWIERMD